MGRRATAADIKDPQSLNRYSYVLNNPLNLIDTLGLEGEEVTVTCDEFGNCFQSAPLEEKVDVDGSGCGDDCFFFFLPGGGGGGGGGAVTGGGGGGGGVAAPNNGQQKSPARQACEAKEVAYANRVRDDHFAGSNDRIVSAIGKAAATGALRGAQVGFYGGEAAEPLGGGIPGAVVGRIVGGVVGAGTAALTVSAFEAVDGFFYNHSIAGYGNTYQKQLDANIKKNCGNL